jgi:hypothetical protein
MAWKRSLARVTVASTRLLSGWSWGSAGSATVLLLAVLAAVLFLPGYRPSDLLLRKLQSRIPALSEPELLPHLRRMADLGDEGVAAVARLLGSEDEAAAEAAYLVLSEHLDRWRDLPRAASASRAIHLASVLANSSATTSPATRRYTAELGMRLLLWPAEDGLQASQLVSHCEQILAAANAPGS